MKKLTLIGSYRSPFVRICRIFMIQQGLEFDFKVLNFVEDKNDAAALAQETPINKIPVLIDDGQKIFDSRVIINHLSRKCGLPVRSLDEENLVSVIYSSLDTSIILFLMKRDGFDVEASGFFLERQRARVIANLAYLTPWVQGLDAAKLTDWNYASISLYSYLYYAQKRELLNVDLYPVMADFLRRFSGAVGVQETTWV